MHQTTIEDHRKYIFSIPIARMARPTQHGDAWTCTCFAALQPLESHTSADSRRPGVFDLLNMSVLSPVVPLSLQARCRHPRTDNICCHETGRNIFLTLKPPSHERRKTGIRDSAALMPELRCHLVHLKTRLVTGGPHLVGRRRLSETTVEQRAEV